MAVMYDSILSTCDAFSSNFSSSSDDRKKLNTDSESALKTKLKNGVKCI